MNGGRFRVPGCGLKSSAASELSSPASSVVIPSVERGILDAQTLTLISRRALGFFLFIFLFLLFFILLLDLIQEIVDISIIHIKVQVLHNLTHEIVV